VRRIAALTMSLLLVLLVSKSFCQGLTQVGTKAPDFKAKAYFPAENKFGQISLSQFIKKGKWVVLFFYPADFTFA